MLRNLNAAPIAGRRILGTPYVGLLAAQIVSETAVGDQGAGLLYNEAVKPENAGKRLRLRVTPWPAVGTLTVLENGAFEWAGLPNGVHTASYDYAEDGVYQGGTSFTLSVGVVDATAPGVVLTGSADLSMAPASGEQNATAPGVALTSTADLTTAPATGQKNATAPGVTLTGPGNLSTSPATGGSGVVNASAPGVVLTGPADLATAPATGQQNATAPGVTMTGTADLQTTPAVGGSSGDAVAPGTTLTGPATLETSPAIGQKNATAPGTTLTGDAQLQTSPAHDGSTAGYFNIEASVEKRTRIGLADAAITAYVQEINLENVYLKGEVVRLHARIADSEGRAIDPPGLLLRVRYGTGAITDYVYGVAPELGRLSAGRYFADIRLAERGDMYYRWETAGQDTGAGESKIVIKAGRF